MAALAHRPTYLAKDKYRFLIMDAPTDQNLDSYIEECKKHNVSAVVRACKPSYSSAPLIAAGIDVVELSFPDGDPPPAQVVSKWLDLCEEVFDNKSDELAKSIAVHCVAGLGRAPVLVAISLIESGMEPLDVVEFVRKKRRGAINMRQLQFLEKYEPRAKKGSGCCTIL